LVLTYTEGNTEDSTSPASVVIEGGGREVDLTGTASDGFLITVGYGVTLTLKNITMKGLNWNEGENTRALIKVTSGGKLILGNGAVITDNYNSSFIYDEDYSIFGGGVNVEDGTLAMKTGASISGNTAGYGGGVCMYGGTFTMEGGEISENNASTGSGGVYVVGFGTFTMKNGKISGNNTSTGGGGVYVCGGTFRMEDGEISGNNAFAGGGVCVWVSGTFTMEGGKITGNTATSSPWDSHGGGVYVCGGTFTMKNGKISGNDASAGGGGVCVYEEGAFTMEGGEISGNTANTNGGGVYVYNNGTFIKSGGGTIDANNVGTNGKGKVAYVASDPPKQRDTAAGTSLNMNSNVSGSAGGWE
jgi:hypothetical protein